jgi:RNA polymerase sigma factor (sigma-70 family)
MAQEDFDVTIKFRNNHLVEFREKMGMSAPKFAEWLEVSYHSYSRYESLRDAPIDRHGEWKRLAKYIAKRLKMKPEEIWPESVLCVQNPKVSLKLEGRRALAFARMFPQLPAPDDAVLEKERKEQVEEAFEDLTARERIVLRARFGMGSHEEPLTMVEVGKLIGGRSPERVRQIEAKALRKLRHGKHKQLKNLIDAEG